MSTLPLENAVEGGRAVRPYSAWCPERGTPKLVYAEGPSQAAQAFAVDYHEDWNMSPGTVCVLDAVTQKQLEFRVYVQVERQAIVRWVRPPEPQS